MIRRPPRSTQSRSSAASDVYKRQLLEVAFKQFSGFASFEIPTPQRHLYLRLHGGQRSAELVRSVGGEAALQVKRVFHRFELTLGQAVAQQASKAQHGYVEVDQGYRDSMLDLLNRVGFQPSHIFIGRRGFLLDYVLPQFEPSFERRGPSPVYAVA